MSSFVRKFITLSVHVSRRALDVTRSVAQGCLWVVRLQRPAHYYYYYYYYYFNLGRSSRGGRQKLILEIIALMVNHPSFIIIIKERD